MPQIGPLEFLVFVLPFIALGVWVVIRLSRR